jgi:mono/diheme cytochrome c family protein
MMTSASLRAGRTVLVAGVVAFCSAVVPAIHAGGSQSAAPRLQRAGGEASTQAFLDAYCVTCHNQRLKTAELTLDTMDSSTPAANAAVWEKVLRKVRTGAMPPPLARQPGRDVAGSFVASLEGALDRASAAAADPGRAPAVRRLNRTEYRNAVRELLAIDDFPKEMDLSLLLPADDIGEGFDNMADALYVSPTLVERYLGAARKISRLAIADASIPRMIDTYQMSGDLPQDVHLDEMPFGTRGGVLIRRTFPVDGLYSFALQVARGGVYDPSTASERFEIELTIDGERVELFTEERGTPAGGARQGRRGGGNGALQVKLPVKAGPHEIGVAFLARADAPIESLVVPYRRGRGAASAALSSVTISGPDEVTGIGDTPSRRRIFVCYPASARQAAAGGSARAPVARSDDGACAERILSTLARRAFRRPVTSADVAPLLSFYVQGRAEGGFELGIRRAIDRLLVSPEFLFRIEFDPPNVAPTATYRLTDYQLASRLSFFLWSSLPDDELLTQAGRGRLKNPGELQAQVHRMLADPRGQAFIENFAGQWLYLRDLVTVKRPDDRLFPDFDEGLRRAMAQETELFFGALLRENRSVFDLLRADFTFVNDRLARHYGIPNVNGSQFRRVTLPPESPRRGLLGQGSILTVTSYANRTSPVNRGKFILETLLSMPPPPPPPDVPSLKDTTAEGRVFSMRTRMEQHRANPSCASCHAQMDPLGFALESFDATGHWRSRSEAHEAIDDSATLPDGTRIQGIGGLRDVLLRPPFDREFVRTVIAKMLSYALGRGAQASDEPFIRAIMRDAAPHGYALESVIAGIVNSVPFQTRRSQPPASAAVAAVRP